MLQLNHLQKAYRSGANITQALKDVSIQFRSQEFVAILGPSGSGKTTLLNVIGGLDRYDAGDLVINGRSTKNFKERDWDSYRNNSIGFVFQNYDLIPHLSILANVELGMNLSGVNKKEREARAKQALIEVGLAEHLHKRPNQLSGGQMQRVAIARGIANDPDILLCDEPTGALDTKTSEQIMLLIKKVSAKRLVIMVTHNPVLAEKYASRIVHFRDGQIESDSQPYQAANEQEDKFNLKRTKMSYWNAIKLSFTNIMTKKGRTLLTAFASSIGIISIAVVLAISNGFQQQINTTMSKALAKYPIAITSTATDMNAMQTRKESDRNVKNRGYISARPDQNEKSTHNNKITPAYVAYVKKINPDYANNISYQRAVNLNLLGLKKGKVERVQFSDNDPSGNQSVMQMRSQAMSSLGIGSSVFPTTLNKKKGNFLKQNYQLLDGKWPRQATDLVIAANNKNSVNINALKNLGYTVKTGSKLQLKQLIGKQFSLISNNDFYQELPTGTFAPNKASAGMYQHGTKLKITAVIRPRNENSLQLLASGVAYSDRLSQKVIQANRQSNIVKAQRNSKRNVISGQTMSASEKK